MGKIINTVKSVAGKLIETYRPKNGPTLDIHKANQRIVELEQELGSKSISNNSSPSIDIEAMKVELETKYALQIETLKNEYEGKLNEAKQSANKQAWQTLASLGIEPDLIPSMKPDNFSGGKENNGVTVVNLLNRK